MRPIGDLGVRDGLGLAELVRNGAVSPVELVDDAIERIEALNPSTNAVVVKLYDQARAAAGGDLPTGPFRGVPFLLKDLLVHHVGIPTGNGSRFPHDDVPAADSELVRRFRAAGLVTVGKTNTSEYGLMPVTEPEATGATNNPWELTRTAGGPSGGAAAAVAAGMVPLAHGSDAGGSIRIPASCCAQPVARLGGRRRSGDARRPGGSLTGHDPHLAGRTGAGVEAPRHRGRLPGGLAMSRPARRGAEAGWLAATAAAVYVGTTVLGGVLDPGYSHVSMHVSELTSSHAPNRAFLAALYAGYNLALAGVGLALLRSVLRTRALTVASASLVLYAAVGILLVTWFPQDTYGYPATTAGALHIALAGVAALLGIVAMIAAGRAFRRDERWAPLARLSVWAAIVMVGTGAVGAAATAMLSPLMGLFQRLTIGTFLLWLVVVAWYGLQRPRARGADPVLVPVAGRRSA